MKRLNNALGAKALEPPRGEGGGARATRCTDRGAGRAPLETRSTEAGAKQA